MKLIREKRISRMGVGPLCRLFGKTRQAYYEHIWHQDRKDGADEIALELVRQVRRELPGLGGHKLYKCRYTPLRRNGLKMGRDRLFRLLKEHNLLIDRKKKGPRTTQSNHWYRRYPNLIRELDVCRSNQLWVSDITYICVGYDFNYLSLITDAYSRKIMGYCLHPYLNAKGPITALKMALSQRKDSGFALIHHSDRGVQYCCFDYVSLLKKEGIAISMTENGEAYENPIAERVNGILKTESNLKRVFTSRSLAMLEVARSIGSYNHLRPHMSCNYFTPEVAHTSKVPLIKHWKNRRKKYNQVSEIT